MKKIIFFLATVLVFSTFSAVSAKSFLKNDELLNKRAVKLVIPYYSKEAREAKVQGVVLVQVKVNEKGRVIEANMIKGDPLLKNLCEKAALASIFKPKVVDGKKVKYVGTLQYSFSVKD